MIVDETKSIWHFSNRVALLWHDASSCTVLLLRISPTLHEQKHHFPMLILQLSAANCPRFSEIPNTCGQICIWNEHLGENNLSKEKVSRAASCKGYVEKKPQQDVFGAFTSLPNFFSLESFSTLKHALKKTPVPDSLLAASWGPLTIAKEEPNAPFYSQRFFRVWSKILGWLKSHMITCIHLKRL